MKILVTGALGHIGSRLIRELPSSFPELQIAMMDNLSTQRYASLFNLPNHGHYEFYQEDILTADFHTLLKGVDVVIHLAAMTNAERSLHKREKVMRVNVEGTERLARVCAHYHIPIIFPSTTSVYGKSDGVVDETCSESDLKPQSPYAESKIEAEQVLKKIEHQEGLRFVIFRFGTIYGTSPGMRFHTAVNKFCWQAATKQPITVWETARDQKRPYLDLSDAIQAMTFAIQKHLYYGQVFNVVTSSETVGTIVEMIGSHYPDLSIHSVRSEIMNQLSYDVSAARFASLGFEFKGDLARAIRETIELISNFRELPLASELA